MFYSNLSQLPNILCIMVGIKIISDELKNIEIVIKYSKNGIQY